MKEKVNQTSDKEKEAMALADRYKKGLEKIIALKMDPHQPDSMEQQFAKEALGLN